MIEFLNFGEIIGTGMEAIFSGEAFSQLQYHWQQVKSLDPQDLYIGIGYAFYLYAAYHAA